MSVELLDPSPTGSEVDALDPGSFEELVRRHHARVWRLVWRIVRDDRAVEQLVQEVFLTARRTHASLDKKANFSTWILGLAKSTARSFGRKPRGPAPQPPPTADAPRGEPLRGRPLKPEVTQAMLEDCVDVLDRDLHAALSVLTEASDYDEVAKVLSVPPGSVRSRIFRARQALASCMLRKKAAHGQP
jgi:RNA polymerase sigma-70 factor (ECF subfamily)